MVFPEVRELEESGLERGDAVNSRPGPVATARESGISHLDARPNDPAPSEAAVDLSRTGVIAIGRNEGERLIRALRAVVNRVPTVVYVDSGSTDGSAQAARSGGDSG